MPRLGEAARRLQTETEQATSLLMPPRPKERPVSLGTARRKETLPESRSNRLTGPTRHSASRTKRPLLDGRLAGRECTVGTDARDGPGFPALAYPARCDEHHDAKALAVRKLARRSSRHHRGPRRERRGNVWTGRGHAPSRQRTDQRTGAGSNVGPLFRGDCATGKGLAPVSLTHDHSSFPRRQAAVPKGIHAPGTAPVRRPQSRVCG